MTSMPRTVTLGDEADATRVAQIAQALRSDLPKAIKLAAQAKADGLRAPVVHHLVGLQLKDAGRYEDAIVELGLGLELEPNNPGLMTTVGFCLLELDRRQEAARIFERAMRLDPTSPDAFFGYGWTAERLGALPSAESAFRRAVELHNSHADALAGLGGLALRRRDWRAAREFSVRSISASKTQTDALMNLARADIGEGNFEAAVVGLDSILDLPGLGVLARANTHILRGDALDGLGRFQEAFAAYATGKGDLGRIYADRFGGDGRPRSPEVVRAMLAEFLETPAKEWGAVSSIRTTSPARGHAFLMGFPRSGTTLLEQIIATHPEMCALGERPVMIDAESEFMAGPGGITRLAAVMSDHLEPLRQVYWRRVRDFGIDVAGKVFVDKHPLSTMRAPLIFKMFPRAKIISALRDPRDVVLSCFRRSFNMNANMYEFNSIEGAARFYDAVMTAGEAYLEKLPLAVHRIRLEDLIEDFDGVGGGLCGFLGVPWTESLRDFADTERAIATPSGAQIARGLSAEGVGHWRSYAFALEPVKEILAPWVVKFGYDAW
jgi:Flp pilus assembly protein TadD